MKLLDVDRVPEVIDLRKTLDALRLDPYNRIELTAQIDKALVSVATAGAIHALQEMSATVIAAGLGSLEGLSK
jgi:hypothetical protein